MQRVMGQGGPDRASVMEYFAYPSSCIHEGAYRQARLCVAGAVGACDVPNYTFGMR